jgi:hypothetical protein
VARYTPNQNGAVLPDTHPRISFPRTLVRFADGNFVMTLTLTSAPARRTVPAAPVSGLPLRS